MSTVPISLKSLRQTAWTLLTKKSYRSGSKLSINLVARLLKNVPFSSLSRVHTTLFLKLCQLELCFQFVNFQIVPAKICSFRVNGRPIRNNFLLFFILCQCLRFYVAFTYHLFVGGHFCEL